VSEGKSAGGSRRLTPGRIYLALSALLLVLAGLARSRLHGVLWSGALFDTTLALVAWVGFGALGLTLQVLYRRLSRRAFFRAAVVLLVPLVVAALAEGTLRALQQPVTHQSTVNTILTRAVGAEGVVVFEPSSEGSMGGVPWRTNSLGLRGPEVPLPRPAEGVTRLLVLGDSYTFGDGLEESVTWPRQLERLLRERFPQRRFDLVDASHCGYSAEHQAQALAHFGPLVEPDLVLVGACQNDHWVRTQAYGFEQRYRYSFVPDDLATPLLGYSLLARKVARGYDQVLLKVGLRDEQSAMLERLADPAGENWQAFVAQYARMVELCQQLGTPPPLVQVLVNLTAEGMAPEGGPLVDRYLEGVGSTGAEVFEARARFAPVKADLRLNPSDPHPNPQAHRLYAEAFLAALLERGWLERE